MATATRRRSRLGRWGRFLFAIMRPGREGSRLIAERAWGRLERFVGVDNTAQCLMQYHKHYVAHSTLPHYEVFSSSRSLYELLNRAGFLSGKVYYHVLRSVRVLCSWVLFCTTMSTVLIALYIVLLGTVSTCPSYYRRYNVLQCVYSTVLQCAWCTMYFSKYQPVVPGPL